MSLGSIFTTVFMEIRGAPEIFISDA
jgi:hypothetical protein